MRRLRINRSPSVLEEKLQLAELTTLKVGGAARYWTQVRNVCQLREAYGWARQQKLPVLYLGEGSNLLCSDQGFPGLLIQNRVSGRKVSENCVELGSGENMSSVIRWVNSLQLKGMERMYGIPGTIAGALVGNAGAYGQEIGDLVIDVKIWNNDNEKTLRAADLNFHYRWSQFKESSGSFILSCRLRLMKSDRKLQRISDEIFLKRSLKYPKNLNCPGSFFKNVLLDLLSEEALQKIPGDFIMFGKIPAGKLLEAVGANGAKRGGAQFTSYHGNLVINLGHASSKEILELTQEYAQRVWEKFRIRLEPEIVIVGESQ